MTTITTGGPILPPVASGAMTFASHKHRMKATRSIFSAAVKLRAEHEVEELDRVLECQAAAVVKVRRAVFDATQREALDWTVSRFILEEAL